MRTGVALWGYGKVPLPENVAFFAGAHFHAGSILGTDVWKHDEDTVRRFVTLLELHDVALTVHHKLPDPEDPEAPESFRREIDLIRTWHDRHGVLTGLTFDAPGDKARLMPHLRRVLEAFRDTDVFICCEDFPLNEEQHRILDGLDDAFPNLGVLIDLGHLNMRVTVEDPEQDRAGAVRRHIRAVPLPIRELHVHNNDGVSDQHRHLLEGTLPVDAAGAALREVGFDGISTLEFMPEWSNVRGREAYDLALASRDLWENALGPGP
ncbi:MAG TPA: TIM barrel protein [Planctomycetota bacterium]|nr:TIM barrel protein [Planctomycetota bacterium]